MINEFCFGWGRDGQQELMKMKTKQYNSYKKKTKRLLFFLHQLFFFINKGKIFKILFINSLGLSIWKNYSFELTIRNVSIRLTQ